MTPYQTVSMYSKKINHIVKDRQKHKGNVLSNDLFLQGCPSLECKWAICPFPQFHEVLLLAPAWLWWRQGALVCCIICYVLSLTRARSPSLNSCRCVYQDYLFSYHVITTVYLQCTQCVDSDYVNPRWHLIIFPRLMSHTMFRLLRTRVCIHTWYHTVKAPWYMNEACPTSSVDVLCLEWTQVNKCLLMCTHTYDMFKVFHVCYLVWLNRYRSIVSRYCLKQ